MRADDRKRGAGRAIVAMVLAPAALALPGCLAAGGPSDRPWPPRLEPVSASPAPVESPADRRHRQLHESEAAVFLDQPYH